MQRSIVLCSGKGVQERCPRGKGRMAIVTEGKKGVPRNLPPRSRRDERHCGRRKQHEPQVFQHATTLGIFHKPLRRCCKTRSLHADVSFPGKRSWCGVEGPGLCTLAAAGCCGNRAPVHPAATPVPHQRQVRTPSHSADHRRMQAPERQTSWTSHLENQPSRRPSSQLAVLQPRIPPEARAPGNGPCQLSPCGARARSFAKLRLVLSGCRGASHGASAAVQARGALRPANLQIWRRTCPAPKMQSRRCR